MKLSEIIVLSALGYFGYKWYKQTDQEPMVIDEKDLVPITKLDHNKDFNPLYDPSTGQSVQIKHEYKTQVMPQVVASVSHPYSTVTSNM